jgi:hypothetical protein
LNCDRALPEHRTMGKRAAAKAPSTRYVKGRAVSEVAEWVCMKLDENEAAASEQGTTLVPFMQDTSHNTYVSSEFEHCYCCTHVCVRMLCACYRHTIVFNISISVHTHHARMHSMCQQYELRHCVDDCPHMHVLYWSIDVKQSCFRIAR